MKLSEHLALYEASKQRNDERIREYAGKIYPERLLDSMVRSGCTWKYTDAMVDDMAVSGFSVKAVRDGFMEVEMRNIHFKVYIDYYGSEMTLSGYERM